MAEQNEATSIILSFQRRSYLEDQVKILNIHRPVWSDTRKNTAKEQIGF